MTAAELHIESTPYIESTPSREDDLIFRAREARDDCGLFELFNEEGFLHDAAARGPFASCEDMRVWLEGVVAAQRFEIVGVLRGKVVGFGGLYTLGDGQSHSGWVMLGVREAFQRRGIGAILMHMLIATAQVFVRL